MAIQQFITHCIAIACLCKYCKVTRTGVQASAALGALPPAQPLMFGQLGATARIPIESDDYEAPPASEPATFAIAVKHVSYHNRALTPLELQMLATYFAEQDGESQLFEQGVLSRVPRFVISFASHMVARNFSCSPSNLHNLTGSTCVYI